MAKWQKAVEKVIKATDRANEIAGKFSGDPNEPTPESNDIRLDVVEVRPNRDNKDEVFLFSGTTETVQTQISQFLAIEELLSRRLQSINLEKWIDDYCGEFTVHPGKHRPKDNIINPWRSPYANRPRALITKPEEGVTKDYTLVQFWPDRKNDEDYYWCSGTPLMIIDQIMSLTHQLQLLNSKDIGEFLGWPIREYQALRPSTNVSIFIEFTTKEGPPFYKKATDAYFFKAQVDISNVNTGKLSYANLKKLCGDGKGLVWGHYQARASVGPTTKSAPIGQITASGDDEPTALANLNAFCEYSNSKVLGVNVSHNPPSDPRSTKSGTYEQKKRYKIYPKAITVLNPKKVGEKKGAEGGRVTRDGIIRTKTQRLWLWPPTEPLGWSENLRRALS